MSRMSVTEFAKKIKNAPGYEEFDKEYREKKKKELAEENLRIEIERKQEEKEESQKFHENLLKLIECTTGQNAIVCLIEKYGKLDDIAVIQKNNVPIVHSKNAGISIVHPADCKDIDPEIVRQSFIEHGFEILPEDKFKLTFRVPDNEVELYKAEIEKKDLKPGLIVEIIGNDYHHSQEEVVRAEVKGPEISEEHDEDEDDDVSFAPTAH